MKDLLVHMSALLVLTGAVSGCADVHKSIGVWSDPPGALVYLDGIEVGRTPVKHVPFHFYGVREIALYKDGYLTERREIILDEPWYSRFPIDIFSELLLPLDLRDQRAYYFALRRRGRVETAALMRHAHQTREVAQIRIEGARRESDYQPPAYVKEGAERPSILLGLFGGPPRAEPVYTTGPEDGEQPEEDE